MKNFSLLLLSLLISGAAFCQLDTLQPKTKISDVTIFFSGAQLTRQIELKLNKGKYLLILDKLPQEINPKSIQVNGIANCKILSVKHQLNYQNENKKGKDEVLIKTSIDEQSFKIKEIKNKLNVFELEEKLLLDNSQLSKKEDGASISKIKEAADFYRQRLNEIRKEKLSLITESEDINKKIQELNVQMNELTSKKHKTYSQILITLDCEKPISAEMPVSYFISSAGWEPLYDFRVDDIKKPLSIVYNANVFQSSGEDWNNVNIKLSSNNPTISGSKPEIIPWYLGSRNPYQKENIVKGNSAIKGRILDATTNEGLPFVNVVVLDGEKNIAAATTDMDGAYTIKPIPSGQFDVKVAYLGYKAMLEKNVIFNKDQITFLDFKMQPTTLSLEAFEVKNYTVPLISMDQTTSGETISGSDISRISGGITSGTYFSSPWTSDKEAYDSDLRGKKAGYGYGYFVDGLKTREMETANYISNTLKSNVSNLEYVIEIPYTIPSDGEDYSIKIKEVSLTVDYIYHAVPKLDNDVFLTAEIVGWTELNLLSGKSSIYYQGTFTGESYIDANQAGDTLNVSLGRDRNIIVKREGSKEMNDKQILGKNIKETLGWNITVKNNKTASIKIIVDDQFPVSEKKSIEVERLDYSNAKLDDKTGKLSWELLIEPNDKKVVNFKYSVKYPKYSNLTIE